MAEAAVNGEAPEFDIIGLRRVLLSNSTKRRTAELNSLHGRILEGASHQEIAAISLLLLDTYARYVDTRSRQAVESCISAIASIPQGEDTLPAFIQELETESHKVAIAPANAFVLVRWSSLLIQHAAAKRSLWEAWSPKLLATLTNSLNTLMASQPKESTVSTALRVGRRALRTIAKSAFGSQAIDAAITALSTKAAVPIPKNAVLLGIVAGVCKRLPNMVSVVEARKADYVEFYRREMLGSRVILPTYISNALHDFWIGFVTSEDFKKDVTPSIEKSLLRAPEVVLNDLVAPVVLSLPDGIDLSDVLANNLLKSILSNIKSTNATIRDGALRTFEAIAKRCHDEKLVEKAGDEILTPLKTNKVSSAEQRVIHAQMLGALVASSALAVKIMQGLTPVATKEANEAAASAEMAVLTQNVAFALQHDIKLEASATDAFVKGLAEKRLPMRRLWTLRFADLYWNLDQETLQKESSASFMDAAIGKLVDIFNEVVANPLPAVQSGQVPVACAVTALCLKTIPSMSKLKTTSVVDKASIAERALALEPKPSFLINPRVCTKMVGEEDLRWCLRALSSAYPQLPKGDDSRALRTAWAQAIIFLIVGGNLPPKVRNEAVNALQDLYVSHPGEVSETIIDGLWQWCEDVELEAKESAAVSSKTGRGELSKVLKAVCLAPDSMPRGEKAVAKEVVERQLLKLLVLSRPQLIPRASWIELCLRTGTDPGALASAAPPDSLAEILAITNHTVWRSLPAFQSAAYGAAAELAFVAPVTLTPLIVSQISLDLEPTQLADIGPTEAAIYRTPEGTAFIDVLSKQSQSQPISKNTRDYDTLKWEEELRAQLAAKKGQTKKLTPDEQAKVKAQLEKESAIRKQVADVDAHLRRGIGMISALAVGPPTEAEEWFGPSVKLLFEVIQAGAGLVLGDAASIGYLQCANKTSTRLGPLRPFVGVATLRAAGITMLPENLLAEPLGDLVTRLLYRLRFLGEQRPFETVTLSYILALVFLVLEQGGIERAEAEDADEQIVLAIEVLSFHTEACSDTRLPRERLFSILITAMQRFAQHFRPLKDCFTDLCRCVAPNMKEAETDAVVKGAIVPDQSVRGAVLQAVSAELELADREFYEEVWLACHDDVPEHVEVAQEIWQENDLKITPDSSEKCLPYLHSKDVQLRHAAARSIAASLEANPSEFERILSRLQETYVELAKPKKPELDRYGMPIKKDLSDPFEARQGIALAFKELARVFPQDNLVPFLSFLIESGPLADRSDAVRDSMVDAATAIVSTKGKEQVEPLMKLCESTLESSKDSTQTQDLVNEAVVILYGALARHLPHGDSRVPAVVDRLLSTLSTPSESVQYAVAHCLPPLVRASSSQASQYMSRMINETLHGKKYADRRGAAYGLAGIVAGRGIAALRESRLISTLRAASENKKDTNERQGAFLAYELLSLMLGRIFEPYVIQVVPQLLAGFGDASADVREACLDAAKTCFATLSSFGVKQILPTLLEGLDESQWRSKKGASDSLGAMAYLDPNQLAVSLPEIIPPLTDVLNDTHKEVRASAKRSLQRFGDVITNPEVKSQVDILLKALSDPTKFTDDALDALIKVNFLHYLDAPSLALVVRILERGLGERSGTKRKAAQIIGSLAHLTERKDLSQHLPILVAGLRLAIVDPVPTTRATASKALGSMIEKLGEDALPDLIPSLMATLKSDSGAGDRLGSAQALSEVLAGLGTGRL
ncbi:ARM repeat-containing protein, partial [Hortaea werneckii]